MEHLQDLQLVAGVLFAAVAARLLHALMADHGAPWSWQAADRRRRLDVAVTAFFIASAVASVVRWTETSGAAVVIAHGLEVTLLVLIMVFAHAERQGREG